MNWYKHYIGDYQRDTGHLSMVEHGAYRLMLDTHYATEAPLPKTQSVLFRLLRAFDPAEQAAVVSILAQFWTETPAGYINERSLAEFEKYTNKINAARENGNLGGRPKKTHGITETETETITKTKPATKAPQNQIPDNQTQEPPISPPAGGTSQTAPRETTRKLTLAQAIEAHPGIDTGAITKARRLFEAKGWPEIDFALLWEEFAGYWTGEGARKTKSDWPRAFYNRAVEKRTWSGYQLGGSNGRSKTTGGNSADATEKRRAAIARGLRLDERDDGAGGTGRAGPGTVAHRPGMVFQHAAGGEGPGEGRFASAGSDQPRPEPQGNGGDPGQAVCVRAELGEVSRGRRDGDGDVGGSPVGHPAGPVADSREPHDSFAQIQHAAAAGGDSGHGENGTGAAPPMAASGGDGAAENPATDLLTIPDFLRRKA